MLFSHGFSLYENKKSSGDNITIDYRNTKLVEITVVMHRHLQHATGIYNRYLQTSDTRIEFLPSPAFQRSHAFEIQAFYQLFVIVALRVVKLTLTTNLCFVTSLPEALKQEHNPVAALDAAYLCSSRYCTGVIVFDPIQYSTRSGNGTHNATTQQDVQPSASL